MNLHLLCTVLNPGRLKSNLLTFQTVRKGFPTANIFVYGNDRDTPAKDDISLVLVRAATSINAEYRPISLHSHGEWIEKLLDGENEPFWICDPDVVFFDKVEDWFDHSHDVPFAGRYEPEFWEEWTETVHVARLHPSLMWFNPTVLRAAMRAWPGRHQFFNSVQSNLFQWSWVPEHGRPLKFYDTCAGLYHALGGQQFNDEENKAFEHVFCSTYADLIEKQHPNLKAKHDMLFENPAAARGMWQEQQEWYRLNSIQQAQREKELTSLFEELTAQGQTVPQKSEYRSASQTDACACEGQSAQP